MLARWAAQGHPLATARVQGALSALRAEEELESLWKRALNSITMADAADLEIWCSEAAARNIFVPSQLREAAQALRGQERAVRAEEEFQTNFKARVSDARMRDDTAALRALAMEAKLLGEDSSAVDVLLDPGKASRRKRPPSTEPAMEQPASKCSIKYIKEELAKRGISSAGIIEKDELQNLLNRHSKYSPDGPETSDGVQGDPLGAAPAPRPQVPPSPRAPSSANLGVPCKPPVGPRMRPSVPPPSVPPPSVPRPRPSQQQTAPPPGPASEEPGPPRSPRPPSRSRAAFTSAWSQLFSGSPREAAEAGSAPASSSRAASPAPRAAEAPTHQPSSGTPFYDEGGPSRRRGRPSSKQS